MRSAVFDAASITPDIGLITRPPMPFAAPSKNPGSPFFYAPWIGWVTTPVKPFLKPYAILLAPFARPPITWLLLSFLIYSLYFVNVLSSSTRRVRPLLRDPVRDSTVLKVPLIVFVRREAAPLATPFDPSSGLISNPSAGSSTRSLKPEPIFWTKVIGLPKIVKLPIIGKSILDKPSW